MATANAATTGANLSGLPRSVRWSIQLGLYVDPSKEDPTAGADLELIRTWNKAAIQQHQERFQKLMEKYVEEEVPHEEQNTASSPTKQNATDSSGPLDLDPLTAMVQEQEARETRKAELYLKYRKEKAMRKRGLKVEPGAPITGESDGIDRASLQIIEKDLKRLPHPSGTPVSPDNLTPEQEARITALREILYIYAQEHPEMGYRQGMHELASYLLFVLELEQPLRPTDNAAYQPILPVCYTLLEKMLDQLLLAYDASVDKSLQQMSLSILAKIYQNDQSLFHHLTSSPNIPPPPIYCTRWVRLLFSREVVGYENVLKLWDVFLEYPVMRALEVCSAARILLLRDALLNPQNNPLDLLMNVPQLEDITPLTGLLRLLMEQQDADQAIEIPQHQMMLSPPRTPPKSPLDHQNNQHPLQQPDANNSQDKTNFSFTKMRMTIGQKGESLRKKIITTTNEWKQQNTFNGSVPDQQSINNNNNMNHPATNTNFIAAAGEAIRQHSQRMSKPTETMLFGDPLLHPPPSPQQHQHERWSQMLKQRIWTVQEFLMTIESNASDNPTTKVPREIWEALADMDKMQQELHNYSVHMAGNGNMSR